MGEILTAVALLLVLEGIIPFISPGGYKNAMSQVVKTSDQTLRSFGLGIMVAGVALLYLVH